jgi:hypothetical protein
MMLTAVAAYAQGTITISVNGSQSFIRTSAGTFPVGDASLGGTCSSDGSGGVNFDLGDGSSSTFSPVDIPSTNLHAVFVACNPLGSGNIDGTGFQTSALSVQVKLTGSLIGDVGDNCATGCITTNLSGSSTVSGTVTVTSDQVFTNCNSQDFLINGAFGLPGDVTASFAETADTSACQ